MSTELLKCERPAREGAGLSEGTGVWDESEKLLEIHSDPSAESQPLSFALRYAARGWHVFPCKPDKRPYTPNGFHNAVTDESTIRSWWSEWPHAIPGVRTGVESGVFVLDVDRPKVEGGPDGEASLAELESQHGVLPTTLTARTPRGGRHLFFKTPQDGKPVPCSVSKIGPALDVRADGGYVTAAPGRTTNGQYAWADSGVEVAEAPSWLVESARKAATTLTTPRDAAPAIELDLPEVVAAETAWLLSTAPPAIEGAGGDATTFKVAARLRARGLSEEVVFDLLWRFWNDRCAPAWEHGDLARKVANAFAYGRSAPGGESAQAAFETWEGPAHLVREPMQAATEDYPHTEDGAAQHFVDANKDRVRFNVSRKQWLTWAGTHWKPDETRKVADRIRKLCRHHSQHAKPLATNKAVRAVEALAQTDQRIVVTADQLDKYLWLLGTPGGVVDLRTGVLREGRPEDGITKLTSCAPSETEDCPVFLRFIDEITLGDAELQRFLKQFFGYCLTGSTLEEVLMFGYGPGGNGKSKLIETIMHIMHDYAKTASVSTFVSSKNDRHTTELATLAGARLVSANETEGGHTWAEARVKQITGGDTITARFMRQDDFSYKPQLKLCIMGNKKPALNTVDDAMRRRFLVVPFMFRPDKKDSDLLKKLVTEAPGILRWLISGCLDWQKQGLMRPSVVVSATQEYFETQDAVGSFLSEHCELDGDAWCLRSEAYSEWTLYAKANGLPHKSQPAFSDDLRGRGIRAGNKTLKSEGKTFRAFIGMRITSTASGCSAFDKF